MEDMIMFEAIFIPKPNNENTNIYGRNARLVVSAEVYKSITGFYPITYNEYSYVSTVKIQTNPFYLQYRY